MGAHSVYLGWKITLDGLGPIYASQPILVDKSIATAGLTDATTRTSPLPKHTSVHPLDSATPLTTTQQLTFKSSLGDLRYLADCTRPDISFATSHLARHTHAPSTHHYQLLKHVLQYLKYTSTHYMHFPDTTRTTRMTTHSYFDYAESEDRNVTSGAEQFLYNSLVSS